MNIRTAVLYRKKLAELVEESVGHSLVILLCSLSPSYLAHNRSPSSHTNVSHCSDSPAAGASASSLLSVRLLGQIQVQEVRNAVL